jgi:hypothetical protein
MARVPEQGGLNHERRTILHRGRGNEHTQDIDYRRRVGLSPHTKTVPISVVEYDEKYSELMKGN